MYPPHRNTKSISLQTAPKTPCIASEGTEQQIPCFEDTDAVKAILSTCNKGLKCEKEVVLLAAKKYTIAEISTIAGVAHATASRIKAAYKKQIAQLSELHQNYAPDTVAGILACLGNSKRSESARKYLPLIAQGIPVTEIVQRCGVSHAAIYQAKAKYKDVIAKLEQYYAERKYE